jgi:glycosyltransferase involved in cell wall biosynthesis
MKVCIITVCYNSKAFIASAINSVLSQVYSDIEYIIIDGASTDGTVSIVESFGGSVSHFVSELDKGIYYAMNKGLVLATGDVIGILNSDDFYHRPHSISEVVEVFEKNQIECVYTNIRFVV